MGDPAEGWGSPCEPRPREPVPIRHGTRTSTVTGYRFGAWSVHRAVPIDDVVAVPDPSTWAVSHVPTGMALGSWVAELTFWDAVRVATALEDSGLFLDVKSVEVATSEDTCLVTAVVGAALQDHYVYPIITEAHHG